MHDDTAFERQIGIVLGRMGGPEPTFDAVAIARTAAAPPSKWRFQPVLSAVRFVVAGAIVALFGGLLLGGTLLVRPDREPVPAVGASAPAETPVAPSPRAVASDDPVAVEAVDWVSVADSLPFERTYLSDVAVAPGGEAVIVGQDLADLGHRLGDARVWWSPDGREWRSGTLPDPEGARPREVIATQDGFVATGWVMDSEEAGHGVIWTTTDGSDWSPETFEGAEFTDLDRVGDTVVVAGEQGGTPTVWTSTGGGPWQPVTIAPAGSGFTVEQVALSADGVYLVLDTRTGELYRSEDGMRFRPVDLPRRLLGGVDLAAMNAGEVDPERGLATGISLTGAPTGFRLMVDHSGADALTAWASSDGLVWRPEVSLPESLWYLDRRAFYSGSSGSDLAFLQADGTWCTVPSPIAGRYDGERLWEMAWNDRGDVLMLGTGEPDPSRHEMYGDPTVWQATGARCGQ